MLNITWDRLNRTEHIGEMRMQVQHGADGCCRLFRGDIVSGVKFAGSRLQFTLDNRKVLLPGTDIWLEHGRTMIVEVDLNEHPYVQQEWGKRIYHFISRTGPGKLLPREDWSERSPLPPALADFVN